MVLHIKLMQSGAFETMGTVNLYTGADVVAVAAIVGNTAYNSPEI